MSSPCTDIVVVIPVPLPWKHEIENIGNCGNTIRRSSDIKTCSPSLLIYFPASVATVSGLIGLCRVSPGLLNIANSSWEPTSMYSTLAKAMVGESSVEQVKMTSCPGHTFSLAGTVLERVNAETDMPPDSRKNNIIVIVKIEYLIILP
jgi:hypothetical protein